MTRRCQVMLAIALSVSTVTVLPARAGMTVPGRMIAPLGTEQSFSIQLHTHGPLSESSGSVQWHHERARAIGVDAIWWTDHDWRVTRWNHTTRYDFENTIWDASNQWFVEPDDASPGDDRYWELYSFVPATARFSVVDSLAIEGTKSLRLEIDDTWNSPVDKKIDLQQFGERKQMMYALMNDFSFHFAVFPEELDPATDKFVIHVTLSERETEWHTLRYVLGSMAGEGADAIPLAFTPGQWNAFDLDITADAKAIYGGAGADSLRGEDNNVFELRVQLVVRDGGHPIVFFDDVRYSVDESITGLDLLDWVQTAGDYFEQLDPGTTHLVGSEISRYRAQPHMNVYTDGAFLVDYTGTDWSDSLYYAVNQVHAVGGLVSYNHPWGTGVYGVVGEPEASKLARIDWMKGIQLGTRLYGCDMLEVGYRWRHGIRLDGHLDLWDTMTGNAIFTTGTGVTDSHGTTPFLGWAPWIPGNAAFENNFVSWFWGESLDYADAIDGLAAGRVWFGDPYMWQGDLDLVTLDGFAMGKVVVTDQSSHDLAVEITNTPETGQVELFQAEIRDQAPDYRNVNVLRSETLSGTNIGGVYTDVVTIDTTIPSFVRVVMSDSADSLAFSNPIHFVTEVPADGIPARRVAARLEDVRLTSAESLTLRDIELLAGPDELVVTVDEEAPGLGQLVVDPGARGAPGAVVGATTWNWDGSRVTATGFSGVGSEVRFQWDVVSVLEPGIVIREVGLSTGRPNPFGRGLVTEVYLPSSGQVFVEVLDVTGRRIRVLADERRDAGVHRVTWDGNDPWGHPVADGVYFLRLRALGRSVTTKAVKLR